MPLRIIPELVSCDRFFLINLQQKLSNWYIRTNLRAPSDAHHVLFYRIISIHTFISGMTSCKTQAFLKVPWTHTVVRNLLCKKTSKETKHLRAARQWTDTRTAMDTAARPALITASTEGFLKRQSKCLFTPGTWRIGVRATLKLSKRQPMRYVIHVLTGKGIYPNFSMLYLIFN